MKILNQKIISLYLVFQMFLPGSVFAADLFEDEDVIWEAGKNVFIKYAEQDDANFGKNDHPVILTVEEISKALDSLKIMDKDRSYSVQEQQSVFTVDQIGMLSPNLAKGLAKAEPNQDISFALEKSVKRSFALKPNRFFVAGRAFYKDEKLNIIIGDFDRAADEGFEAAYDPTHVGIVRYHFDHGRRTKSSKGFKKPVITLQGVENKQLKGTRRSDWLVIDLKLVSEASEEASVVRARMLKTEEQPKNREELKESVASDELNPSHAAAVAPVPATPTRSFEERLNTLNQLRDKGLISDEEYAMKRKQILQDL